tara:strand:+ start:2879 stop:3160 length:282 start_codon:yes stop_codon:yes gene_type:complete
MVCVVRFVVEIKRSQRVRQDPRAFCFVGARQTEFGTEVGEDRGRLVDQQRGAVLAFAGDAQGGWGEGGRVGVGAGGVGGDERRYGFDAWVGWC